MNISDFINRNLNKAILIVFVLVLSFIVYKVTMMAGPVIGIGYSLVPFFVIMLVVMLKKPHLAMLMLFIANYFAAGISRYVYGFPPGIFMDGMLGLVILVAVMQNFNKESEINVKSSLNPLIFASFVWLLYCILQLLNPGMSVIAWMTNVRGIGIYFFIIVSLVSIVLRKYEYVKKMLFVWALLSLFAIAKALMQRYWGFDTAEWRWLEAGGRTTHIINYGIRYFSFFTDAANFGSGMGFSAVVFFISSFFIEKKWLKRLLRITSFMCIYALLMSGTRASVVIPFVGLTVYAVLSKNIRAITITFVAIFFVFAFLKYTYIGHSNQYIRRSRSVFSPNDASLVVRLNNQRILKEEMRGKPFGIGVGMMRGHADTYSPHPILSKIPHDSWYVLIWVELGIVGLVLYISILLFIAGYGGYLVMFRLKNRELKGIVASFVGGLSGLYVAAYTLEIFGQFPNAFIIFTTMAFIFLSPHFDKELESNKELEIDEEATA